MTWSDRIISAHLAVTQAVSHAARMKSERYFVWQEDGSNDLEANGVHQERAVTGSTDLFTKVEFDPWTEALGRSFDRSGIAWRYLGADYEDETGFFHHTWDWEVC